MPGTSEAEKLQSEIVNLFQYIQRFREEIARISIGGKKGSHFKTMSEQLDAIVTATEEATHGILENLEAIEELTASLREIVGDGRASEICDKISEHVMQAMEACTFQDITGQRVTKVVRSMKFVEERVNTMVALMGRDAVSEAAAQILEQEDSPKGEEALLNGPQLAGEAISQDEIDKLFD